MSNLLNDAEGRSATIIAQRFLLQRRLSRFFKRNLVIDYEQWSKGLAEFDLSTLLGSLNEGHDDEIRDLYRLLGTIGGLPVSIADTSIYVDGTNGNDVTGTGSASRPYKTMWFLDFIPQRINHIYRILILNTVAQSKDLVITNSFGGEGCLSFIGVGAETEMYAGLGGVLTAAPVSLYASGYQIQTSVDPTSPVFNTFIQYTSGASQGRCAPVDNAVPAALGFGWQGVLTRNPSFAPANGDSYRYIVPTPTISFADECGLTVQARGDLTVSASISGRKSFVNFANMNLLFDMITAGDPRIAVDSTVDVGFWFVRAVLAKYNDPMVVLKSNINSSNPIDTDITSLTQSTVTNIEMSSAGVTPRSAGLFVCQGKTSQYTHSGKAVIGIEKDPQIWQVSCSAAWRFTRATPYIYECSGLSFHLNDSKVFLQRAAMWGDFTDVSWNCLTADRSEIYFFGVCFGFASALVYAKNTRIEMVGSTVGHDDAIIPIGIAWDIFSMDGLSSIFLTTAWAGSASTGTDILWNCPAVPLSQAFPAVSTSVNDGLGSVATRGVS